MAGMDRPSRLHPRGSDSPDAPLRFILPEQEDTSVYARLFHAIEHSVSVHHGVRNVQFHGHANNFANWWIVLLRIEYRVEFLHVLDTSARV